LFSKADTCSSGAAMPATPKV